MSEDNEVPTDDESTLCFCADPTGQSRPSCSFCAGSGHYTDTNHRVTCPWCGYADEDTAEINLEDGEEEETECPNCDRVFHLKLTITYAYEARRPKPGS